MRWVRTPETLDSPWLQPPSTQLHKLVTSNAHRKSMPLLRVRECQQTSRGRRGYCLSQQQLRNCDVSPTKSA